MNKKIKQFTIATLMFVLVLPTVVLATDNDNPPTMALLVYGNVTIDGHQAPNGTAIIIENNNVEIFNTTVNNDGKYFAEIPAENAGDILTYKVNGTVAAQKECANPYVIPNNEINLAVPTPTATPAPSSSGGIYTPPALANPTPTTLQTTPTVPPTPPFVAPQVLGVKISAAEEQINKILAEAGSVMKRNWGAIVRDAVKEKNSEKKYIASLVKGLKAGTLDDSQTAALNEFIAYGTDTTKILGAGERAGVISSYRSAFGKLPKTEIEWQDAIKIANGRWPSVKSTAAETKAKTSFKKIYGRAADMNKPNDNAAVTIMAYGLRPSARNLNSEKTAIVSFKYFYKRAPSSAADWDAVRAIAYSGAKR